MKQSLLQEKYPVFTLEVDKFETDYESVEAIIAFLKKRIEAHAAARFIAIFDHYAHTRSLTDGQIGEGIRAALNIVFCFGLTLPEPRVLAVRPRSIGVADMGSSFVISFMEAPMPVANMAMEQWAKAIRRPQTVNPSAHG